MTAAEILATIPFPDPRELARERGAEFQRLTPDTRWRELATMSEAGWSLVRRSPHRQVIERQMADHEAAWYRSQQEAFATYGR